MGESTDDQKRTKPELSDAIRSSQRIGDDEEDWGPGQAIAKERPESILNRELVEFSRFMHNVFCPTGEGGGIDPTCSPGEGGGYGGSSGGGSSGRKEASIGSSADRSAVGAALANIFRDKGDREALREVANLVGAPDDATVTIESAEDFRSVFFQGKSIYTLKVLTENDKMESHRRIQMLANGQKIIHNDLFLVKPEFQGQGLGAKVFADQVEAAAREGFSHIETTAAGQKGTKYNGYYTWPLMGYDKDIGTITGKLRARIKRDHPEAKKVSDIILKEGGAAWWKENGSQLEGMKFDLKEGSLSRRMLAAYLKQKASKPTGNTLRDFMMALNEPGKDEMVEDDSLTESDEQILLEAWEEERKRLADDKNRVSE